MCHGSILSFAAEALDREDIAGRAVLEVGSRDVNGSLRSVILPLGPRWYHGVDIQPGAGVDEICNAEDLLFEFGSEAWDVVLCSEMLEHVEDWRACVGNLKGVVRPGGLLLVTTRSQGFPWHAHPSDCWRYELEDMRRIFADFAIGKLQSDPEAPGVLMLARKHALLQPESVDLTAIELHRMVRTL